MGSFLVAAISGIFAAVTFILAQKYLNSRAKPSTLQQTADTEKTVEQLEKQHAANQQKIDALEKQLVQNEQQKSPNADLEKELAQKARDLESSQKRNLSLEAAHGEAKQQIAVLEKKLSQQPAETPSAALRKAAIEQAAQETEKLRLKVQELEQQITLKEESLQTQAKQHQQALNQKDSEIQTATVALKELQANQQNTNAPDTASLERKISTLETHAASDQLTIAGLEAKNATHQERITELETQVTNHQQTIRYLESKTITSQEEISDIRDTSKETISTLEAQATAYQQTISGLEAKIAAQQQILASLEVNNAQQAQNVSSLEAKNNSYKKTISELEAENISQQRKIGELGSRDQTLSSMEAKTNSLQQTISSLEAKVKTHQQTISGLEAQNVSDQKTISELEEKSTVHQRRLGELEVQITTQQQTIRTLETKNTTNHIKILELEAHKVSAEKQIKHLSLELAEPIQTQQTNLKGSRSSDAISKSKSSSGGLKGTRDFTLERGKHINLWKQELEETGKAEKTDKAEKAEKAEAPVTRHDTVEVEKEKEPQVLPPDWLEKRLAIMAEVRNSIISYNNSMKAWSTCVVEPLRSNGALEQAELDELLVGSDAIIKSAAQMETPKVTELDENSEGYDVHLCDALICACDALCQTSDFINHLPAIQKKIEDLKREKEPFKIFMKTATDRLKPDHPDSILIKPVQRVPQLEMFFGDLLKNTCEQEASYRHIEIAIKSLGAVGTHLNRAKKRDEEDQELKNIENSIQLKNGRIFVSERRRPKAETESDKMRRKASASVGSMSQDDKGRFKEITRYDTPKLRLVAISELEGQKKIKFKIPDDAQTLAFVLENVDTHKQQLILAGSKSERDEWIKLLKQASVQANF